jgi:DNA polymerase-3 subunit delta
VSRTPPKKPDDAIDFQQFRKQINAGQMEKLYLFTGEEDYLNEKGLDLLYDTVEPDARSFCISIFAGTGDGAGAVGPPAGQVIATAKEAVPREDQSPRAATRRRIVAVREFERWKEAEVDLVIEYLKEPVSWSTVVFQSPSLDKRRRITTALLKACTIVSMNRLSEREAAQWVVRYLKRRACTIDRGAVDNLVALTGTQMRRLAHEMDKLATYSGGGVINNATVEELVPRGREHTNFELWDAIVERDTKRALRLAHRLLADGNEPVVIVGSLAGLYRRMLLGKELLNKGTSTPEIMRATGQYGPRGGRFNARLLSTAREEIVHGLRRIARADDAIKNSEATPRLQIEYLVAELTLPEAASWGILAQ